MNYGKDNNIEKGRTVRVDCTVVESNIYAPYDSDLLMDEVRYLLCQWAKTELADIVMEFSDHPRRAKRRSHTRILLRLQREQLSMARRV